MKWLSWKLQSLKYPEENSKQMLRLRNGNGLTEELEAVSSLRLTQGVEYDYCSKLLFSVVGFLSVVTPMVLLL